MLGGAACGPANPMQQLGKRFGHDRGPQFDMQLPARDAGPAAFRTRAGQAENPEFFAGGAPGALDVAPLRHALPAAPPADLEASFQRSTHAAARAARAAPAAPAAPSWAADFLAAARPAAGPSAARPAVPMVRTMPAVLSLIHI